MLAFLLFIFSHIFYYAYPQIPLVSEMVKKKFVAHSWCIASFGSSFLHFCNLFGKANQEMILKFPKEIFHQFYFYSFKFACVSNLSTNKINNLIRNGNC